MNHHLLNFTRNSFCAVAFLAMLIARAAGGPAATPTTGVLVQSALPTATPEPTFTPAPAPTAPPQPSPTTIQSEPTATAAYQVSLLGRILDQATGQPVAGAMVSLDAFTATTDADGRYTLTDLSPGQYVLAVTHKGYDPALSSILTLNPDQIATLDLELYATDTTPYPQDPMLTNPLDPNGAPTAEDAERLARLQGLAGEVVSIEETKLRDEFLINYKIGDEVRSAVAELSHDAWELTDDAGQTWWIIKVCGNLARMVPQDVKIATPKPVSLPPMAEVVVDGLVVRGCASETCAEVGAVSQGTLLEVLGCLADGSWCQVGLPGGGSGWCAGQSLRQLAVAVVVPVIEAGEIIYQGEGGLWLTKPDGSDKYLVISEPKAEHPAWSPDGEKISFTTTHMNIIIAEPDTGERITEINLGHTIEYPAPFSPDGQHLALAYNQTENKYGGSQDICVLSTDGSDLTCLTETGHSYCPSWSPSGDQIIFSQSERSGTTSHTNIHTIRMDGASLRKLTSSGINTCPSWSPDGQFIAYFFREPSTGQVPKTYVYVMNADGSNPRPLAFDSAIDLGSPSWSPDGTMLAVYGGDGPKRNIYLVPLDGSPAVAIAEGAGPAWRPMH